MASAERLKDDHLTCSICYMPFSEPKTLQCLHTFCSQCLQHHIQHTSHPRGIPCPVCRHVTTPEDSMQPRYKWASLIKTDFKLTGILEALHQMEKDTHHQKGAIIISGMPAVNPDRKSQLNTILQVMKPAVNFMQIKMDTEHQKVAALQSSLALVEEQIKVCSKTLIDIIEQKGNKLLGEVAQVYDQVKIESEATIEQLKSLYGDTQDTIGLIDRLLSPGSEYATMECMPRIQKQQADVMRFVTESLPDSPTEDITFRSNGRKFQSMLRALELGTIEHGAVHEQMMSFAEQMVPPVQCHADAPTETSDVVAGRADAAEASSRRSSHEDFPAITNDLSGESLHDPPHPRPTAYIQNISSDVIPTRRRSSEVVQAHGGGVSSAYVLRDTIETKCIEDNYVPSLKNIVILECSTSPVIIVLDYDNASIKAFHDYHGQVYADSHRFSGYPQSISKLSSDKVIVSLMNYKFVIFTADLKQLNSIESEKWYTCMATFITQEKLFGFVNTTNTTIVGGRLATIDHLSLKGKPMTKFLNSASAQELFSEVSHLCAKSGNRIVVSDCLRREVVCITLEGVVLWRVGHDHWNEPLNPGSSYCDSNGDVFMIDSYRVLKLSGVDGHVIEEILSTESGLSDPVAICLDSRDYIYVSQQDGNVLVFSQ